LIYSRSGQHLPTVGGRTIPPVVTAISGNGVRLPCDRKFRIREITDAVRPSITALYSQPSCLPPLNGEHHSFEAARSAVLELLDPAIELPLREILNVQSSADVNVAGHGTNRRRCRLPRKRARAQS